MTDDEIPLDEQDIDTQDGVQSPGDWDRAQVRLSRWLRFAMIFVAMTLVTTRLLEADPLGSANDRSRWCTVWSLVERGTFQIDEIRRRPGWDTIDMVRHEGHFYSSKPPLLPCIAAVMYRVIKVFPGWTLDKDTAYVTRLILFFLNVLPMTAALYVMSRWFKRHVRTNFGEALLLVTVCFGTLLVPFLTVFNNHTVAATSVVFAVTSLLNITMDRKREWWRFAIAGFFAAFVCCNELPAAALSVALFALAFRESRTKACLYFIPAALIPLIAFFATTYAATGSWKPFYMYYGTEKYEYVHEGVPSYWVSPKGIDQNLDTPVVYLFHCLFGHHGIFSLSPIFLVALAAWTTAQGWKTGKFRLWNMLSVGLTGLVLGFYLTKTDNYNYGGVSVALRWMLWLIPLWIVSMIPLINLWGNTIWFRWLSIPLVAISIFSAWHPQNAPWTQPWLFHVLVDWKLSKSYENPRPRLTGNQKTWLRSLPTGELQQDYWVQWSSTDGLGLPMKMRLSDAGPVEIAGRPCRSIRLERTEFGQPAVVTAYSIDLQVFAEDKAAPSALLAWPQPPNAAQSFAAMQFLSGVPGESQYRPTTIRYLKTPARRDAFECLGAWTSVGRKQGNKTLEVRRDGWLSEEVPFGLVQWDDRVVEARTRAEQSHQAWVLESVGKTFPRTERE